ncbi:MAG: ferritin-like domain-containing protein [Micromonosporaceae bacterium]
MTGLADALSAEHAAVFGYGAVGAHLRGALLTAAQRAEDKHRARRNQLLERLADASPAPPAAEPAYPLPFAVSDQDGAIKLALHLEERTAAVWRATLGTTRGADRELGVAALVDCAVRASRWRTAAKQPPTVALPGSPT